MTTALLCLNLVNDFIDPEGKLAAQGYADFAKEHDVLQRVKRIQDQFRQQGAKVVHARYRFSDNYFEVHANNAYCQAFKQAGALQHGTWGVEFYPETAPDDNDAVITKHRLSAFYRTRLELILSSQKIENLYICGAATRAAIATTAREAMDRDFNVTVLSDACIDKNMDSHLAALKELEEFITVAPFADVAVKLAV